MRLGTALIFLILCGCASRQSVTGMDVCKGVWENVESADLRVYLAEWESEGLRGELRALREKVASFLRHPHTCRHKGMLR